MKLERVKEAVFSIERISDEMVELNKRGDEAISTKEEEEKATGALTIIEATRFWVREDAVNGARDEISLETLRPLVQLGGISYGRVRETFELPRPSLEKELKMRRLGLRE